MSAGHQRLVLGVAWVIAIAAAAGATILGFVAADAVPSESATEDWHMKSVLAGWGAAAGVLIVLGIVLHGLARSLDAHDRSQLARRTATILAIPPALVTLFFLMLLGSGGSEDFAVSDVLAGWAVLAGPLAVASAGLFVVERRAGADALRDQADPGTNETA